MFCEQGRESSILSLARQMLILTVPARLTFWLLVDAPPPSVMPLDLR